MTLKTLVTGAAAFAVLGAAAGATSVAAGSLSAAPQVQPVVFDVPMPLAPAQELEGALRTTLNGLASPGGSFSGSKAHWIEGGVGRIEGRTADRLFENAAAEGYFPLNFSFGPIDSNGATATTTVTASGPKLAPTSQPLTFVNVGDRWVLSKSSAMALLAAVG